MPPARLAQRIAAAELPIILALAPVLWFPTPRRLTVLAAVPVIWLCVRLTGNRPIPTTPMNATLGLLLTMVGVSLYATFDIQFSLAKVSGVALGVLLFWAIARWLTTPERLRLAIAAFVLAGAGLAVIGLAGTRVVSKFPVLDAISARLPMAIRYKNGAAVLVPGVPGAENGFNPNAVSGCLILFVPLQVALLSAGVHRWPYAATMSPRTGRWLIVLQAGLLLLTTGTTLLMQSRAAWGGLAIAAVAASIWLNRLIRILAGVAAGAVAVQIALFGPASLVGWAMSRAGFGDISSRVHLWAIALQGIQDFPLTGMGMNAFRKVMHVRYPPIPSSAGVDFAHAHNHLLQAALDLGLPGLVAYTALWLTAAALLVSVYRQSQTRVYRSIAGGIGAGLIAHFVFGMTDAIPLGAKVGILFWMTLALTVGLHRVALPRPSNTSDQI